MSTVIIPTTGDLGNYDEQVEIGGAVFGLQFRYNAREACWYLNLLDVNGTILRAGVKLVPNWPLLRLMVDLTRPEGELVALDSRAVSLPPALADLSTLVQLAFVGGHAG